MKWIILTPLNLLCVIIRQGSRWSLDWFYQHWWLVTVTDMTIMTLPYLIFLMQINLRIWCLRLMCKYTCNNVHLSILIFVSWTTIMHLFWTEPTCFHFLRFCWPMLAYVIMYTCVCFVMYGLTVVTRSMCWRTTTRLRDFDSSCWRCW